MSQQYALSFDVFFKPEGQALLKVVYYVDATNSDVLFVYVYARLSVSVLTYIYIYLFFKKNDKRASPGGHD